MQCAECGESMTNLGEEYLGMPVHWSCLVARRLAVSRSTVYRWYWEGRLRGVRLDSGTIRILESAVREKLAKKK